MMKRGFRVYAIALIAALFSSCAKESVPETSTGRYALVDGTDVANQYIVFEGGKMNEYTSSEKYTFVKNSFWHCEASDFSQSSSQKYYIENNEIFVNGLLVGNMSSSGKELTLNGKSYEILNSFKSEYYSTISALESVTVPYQSNTQSIDVAVNNPISSGILSATSSDSWISDISLSKSNDKLAFAISSTNLDRTGKIILKYTNAQEVTLTVNQKPSAYITLPSSSGSTDYKSKEISFDYSIENPLASSSLSVKCDAAWVSDINVNESSVTFKVSENATTDKRTANFTLSYVGASDISYTLTQNSTTTEIVLTESSKTINYAGGTQSVGYAIENPHEGTSLAASTEQDWITDIVITSDKFTFNVCENNSGSYRSGKITLEYGSFATKDFIVEQSWSSTEISLTPTSQSVDYKGGDNHISYSITNPRSGVSLAASSQDNWITNIKVSDDAITYSVAENNSGASRSGKITLKYGSFASKDFSVTQSWSDVVISTTPTSESVDYKGGSKQLTYSIANPHSGTSLTASSQNDWIKDIKVSDNTITYTVSENNTGTSRNGKITLKYGTFATKEFSVTQSWSDVVISTTPASESVNYKGGDKQFTYSITNPHSGTSLTASTQNDWIKDVKVSENIVTYAISENNSGSSRSGKITLKYGDFTTKDFSVEQTWSAVEISVEPVSQTIDYKGGTKTITCSITNPHSGTSLTASSQNDWIKDVKISDNIVTYTVSENNSGSSRSGKITLEYGDFATKDFTVEQTWSAVEISVEPASQTIDYKGGDKQFTYSIINPHSGTSLTASSQDDWIKDIKVADNTITYSVSENNSGSSRSGKITLKYGDFATKDFSVEQTWSVVEISVEPVSQTIDYKGGDKLFTYSITNPHSGTSLSALSQNDWIKDVKISDNTVKYTVFENNTKASRSGKITLKYGSFATKDFTVTQSWSDVVISTTPTSESVDYKGGSKQLTYSITNPHSGTALSASTQDDWITYIKVSDNAITYAITENKSISSRNGNITLKYSSFATKEFSVSQTGMPVQSISLNKTSLTLNVNETSTLIATVVPHDAPLSWSSSDKSVVTVDENGKITAVNSGSATIMVSSNDKTASCAITIRQIPTFSISPTLLSVYEGCDDTIIITSDSDCTFTASSSNTSIATVSVSGKTITVSGKSAGNAAITVNCPQTSKYSAASSLTCGIGVIGPKEPVNLGLSIKWASCNVGASKIEEYGGMYQWAGTTDVTSTSIYLDWINCPYHTGSDKFTGWTKYNTQSSYGTVDNKTVLDLSDDVAHTSWGGSWRMPTDAEWTELRENCTWTWTTINNINGYKVTSKKSGYTDKYIFLPAAGCRADYGLYNRGSEGGYWSSSLHTDDPDLARGGGFRSGNVYGISIGRYYGYSVRPVCP